MRGDRERWWYHVWVLGALAVVALGLQVTLGDVTESLFDPVHATRASLDGTSQWGRLMDR